MDIMNFSEFFGYLTGLYPGDDVTFALVYIFGFLIVYDIIHILFSGVFNFISKK